MNTSDLAFDLDATTVSTVTLKIAFSISCILPLAERTETQGT